MTAPLEESLPRDLPPPARDADVPCQRLRRLMLLALHLAGVPVPADS